MGYDRGDSFPFDFEPNGISFGSKSKGKLSPRSYPIQGERKCKYRFLSIRSRSVDFYARLVIPLQADLNVFHVHVNMYGLV